ncbi:MAG: SLBB domain-containing protein [Symplocastrum torsivum CPER-KK1]|jgi:polysaccharide export outer membrane protein|uniref:SLBB domain-containing protein n=1 Tax=Symplocastrum torsivum CPER-KK1 TaxID=450513 RepID=A0A951UEX4_9CYAN|nr:SLBB domain-containing protein [Symplocastrum torsivum CPER-KK1]
MQYRTLIALSGAALSMAMLINPSFATPIVDTNSKTHELDKAQLNAQSQIAQSIHIGVIGEVQRPGAYFLEGVETQESSTAQQHLPTITRAIQMAGGITQYADVRKVQVRRQSADGSTQTIDVNLYKFLSEGDLSQDIRLQEGDVVVVQHAQS